MIPEKKMASAVGAKTARACDICVRRRARFYCGPDDAFLCQACDDSVHSANPLARRHERVRLKGSSSVKNESFLPTWHRGPTKKPRTPRHRKKSHSPNNHHHLLVPELDTSTSMEEEDEQLLYRVPVFEYDQFDSVAADLGSGISHGFFPPPSDFDMAEFAADVEDLLGKGLDGEGPCGIEELGLLMSSPHERKQDSSDIKIEEEEGEIEAKPFELSFDCDSPVDLKVVDEPVMKKMLLSLDYDAISSSWGNQGSPWMNGKRPDLNPDDDDFLCLSTTGDCEVQGNSGVGLMKGGRGRGDGGREARVSRYREKRRTRLFSKKIRYEVRKLNAEKRPRMKGRFVKRSSFPLLAK